MRLSSKKLSKEVVEMYEGNYFAYSLDRMRVAEEAQSWNDEDDERYHAAVDALKEGGEK